MQVQVLTSVILKMNSGRKPFEEELKIMEGVIKQGKVQQIGQEAKNTTLAIHEEEVSITEKKKEVLAAAEVLTPEADKVNMTLLFFTELLLDRQ